MSDLDYRLKLITGPTVWAAGAGDVREWGRINDSIEDSVILDRIKSATDLIERFTDRILCSQTWEIKLDCFPAWEIQLPKGPWQSITSVKYYNTAGTLTTLASTGYLLDDYGGRLSPAVDEEWPATQDRMNAVEVRWLAGFGATAASVPIAFKDALITCVLDWIENRRKQFELPNGVKAQLQSVWTGTL